jgi:surface antigen
MLELGANPATLGALSGNAGDWANEAGCDSASCSKPVLHSIAQLNPIPDHFSLGHVAVVESINADGTITVTESSDGTDPTNPWMFLWRHRTVAPTWFDHFIVVIPTASTPAPAVSSISPTTMTADGASHTLIVYGSNFQSGNVMQFKWGAGTGAGVWTTGSGNPPSIASSSQMTIGLLPGTVADTIYVRVCQSASLTATANCSSGTQSVAVTAAAVAPVITGVSPNPVTGSSSSQTVMINGTGFVSTPTVVVTWTGGSKTLSSAELSFVSATQLQMTINVGVTADTWTVKVTNPSGLSSNVYSFSVTAAAVAPVVSGISPATYAKSSSNQTMTINGSHFQSGATLSFVPPEGGTPIGSTASKLTFVSSSQLSYQFNDGNDAGNWSVTVINPGSVRSNTWSFTVK